MHKYTTSTMASAQSILTPSSTVDTVTTTTDAAGNSMTTSPTSTSTRMSTAATNSLSAPQFMAASLLPTEIHQNAEDDRITFSQDVREVKELEFSQAKTLPQWAQMGSNVNISSQLVTPNKERNKRQRVSTPEDLNMLTSPSKLANDISQIKGMFNTIMASNTTVNEAITTNNRVTTEAIEDIQRRLKRVEDFIDKFNTQTSVNDTSRDTRPQKEADQINKERSNQSQQKEADQINKERCKDILIHMVPETVVSDHLFEYVEDVLEALNLEDYDTVTRKGPKLENKPRPVKVTLMRERDKVTALKNKKLLTTNEYNYDEVYITDHVSDMTLKEHHILQNIASQLRALGHFAFVPNIVPRQMHYRPGPINKNDRSKPLLVYKIEDYYEGRAIPQIPESVYTNRNQPLVLPNNKGIVFLGKEQLLSNFNSEAPFVLYGETWDMVERLLGVDQARKAGDKQAEAIFKKLDNPHHIKAHFRKIVWKNMPRHEYDMRQIMQQAHYKKFSQTPKALQYIISTGDVPLYEGTRSKYWGIGYDLTKDTTKIMNTDNWHHDYENHCGKSIMEARSRIIREMNVTNDEDDEEAEY